MGTCWNCETQVTLGEERTDCDNCQEVIFYHCNSCKERFEVLDKKTKKKLIECKLCGYFKCPSCEVCYTLCDRYEWEREILRELKPEITTGNYPNLLEKVKNILLILEKTKSGIERKNCPERNIPISYAKGKIKMLLARIRGFRVKNENDQRRFNERIKEITDISLGTKLKISDIREDGTYGQEYRDAFNLLVCLGKLKIIKQSFEENDSKIIYDIYLRIDNQPCKFLDVKNLIINECQKCRKRFPSEFLYCNICPPIKKGDNKGEQWKLKKRVNDKDTCQVYRGSFIKQ